MATICIHFVVKTTHCNNGVVLATKQANIEYCIFLESVVLYNHSKGTNPKTKIKKEKLKMKNTNTNHRTVKAIAAATISVMALAATSIFVASAESENIKAATPKQQQT